MLKNGGDNQIHQPYNLLRIKKAQLSLEILLRRLGSNQCPLPSGYEPHYIAFIIDQIKFLPVAVFSPFSLFMASDFSSYTSLYISFHGLNLIVQPFLPNSL